MPKLRPLHASPSNGRSRLPAMVAPVPAQPTLDFEGKKLARVSFACTQDLKSALRAEAERTGATVSVVLGMLAGQRVGCQRARGKSGLRRDALLESIDALRDEAAASLIDGRVSATERARMTRIISEQLHSLWGERKRA